MNRALNARIRRLEQASAASRKPRCYPIIRATDKADADRQMEALFASGALDGWEDNPFPIVKLISTIAEKPDTA